MPKLAERYRTAADLPHRIAVFPLRGAIVLPRATLPLNIFEPRYLQMVDEAMSTSRVIGMVQPEGSSQEESPVGRTVPLRRIGCAGRVTGYQELDDGRLHLTLTGIARFALRDEVALEKPYRVASVAYDEFLGDLVAGAGEADVDREGFLKALKTYLEARDLRGRLVGGFQILHRDAGELAGYRQPIWTGGEAGPARGATLKARAEMLVALAEMELAAAGVGGTGSTLQ